MNKPFLPDRKPRSKRIALKLGISFLSLAALMIFMSQCGIRVTPPPGSPFDKFNAEAASTYPNAALVYEEALTDKAAFQQAIDSWPNSLWRIGQPIPADVAAWLDDRESTIALLNEANAYQKCRFHVTPFDEGTTTPWMGPMRHVANVLAMRARLAAMRRDLPRFRESLRLLNRMAEHLQQQPTLIAYLIGNAVRGLAVELIPQALEWPELTSGERMAYIAETQAICDEKPLTADLWRGEAELSCFIAYQSMDWKMHMIVPRSRLWGEMTRMNEPVEVLLTQSIERQIDPNNPLIAQMMGGTGPRTIPRALANPARLLAELSFINPTGVIEGQARLVTLQRGMRLLLAITAFAEANGRLPASFNELTNVNAIEPYTSAPFHYRPSGNTFLLYANWLDRDDDGGRHVESRRNRAQQGLGGTQYPDGDRIFWPIIEECPEDQ